MEQQSRSALLEAYLSRRPDLVRFLAARLGNAAAAEDLAQDMYLRLQQARLPDSILDPGAFLYRMAANLALDFRRGQTRQGRRDREWTDSQISTAFNEAVDDRPLASDQIDSRRRLARVIAAVQELPPQQRKVFSMHRLEGLSHADISGRLGISRKTVEKHMTSALKFLMSRFDSG